MLSKNYLEICSYLFPRILSTHGLIYVLCNLPKGIDKSRIRFSHLEKKCFIKSKMMLCSLNTDNDILYLFEQIRMGPDLWKYCYLKTLKQIEKDLD